MKNLIYYINKKYHLRNLYFEINEKLKKLISTEHSHKRKNQLKNDTEDINKNEIIELINKCDDLIINKLLNNKIEINTHKEQFGIIKIGNEIKYKSFACVFDVIYFNKEAFEYDLKIVTTNKEKYIYKFKEDTKFVFEIDKSGYAKEIKI